MLKAIRRNIACPKGLTQLLLTLSFLRSYRHIQKKHSQASFHHTFEGQNLLRSFSGFLFNTRKKHSTISQKIYKLLVTAKSLAQRSQSKHVWCAPHPCLETSGEKYALCQWAASERTLAVKMFLGCWLLVRTAAEDWFSHLMGMHCSCLFRGTFTTQSPSIINGDAGRKPAWKYFSN